MDPRSEAAAMIACKRAYAVATDTLDTRLQAIASEMDKLTTSWPDPDRREYAELRAKWEREVRKLRALGIQIGATIGKSLNDMV